MDVGDDVISFENLYQNGHWEWDKKMEQLVFISDIDDLSYLNLTPTSITIGALKFKDDMDLLEQQRFRKKYQRKTEENDVITLQDVKDLAIYTTPMSILTTSIVNILHLPATERFIRALIIYCQYYLQVSDELSRRSLELHTKVRTTMSDDVVAKMRENMEDLRLLVAKEYSIMILAAGEYRPYHHMGPSRNKHSLTTKECLMFESLLCICIQIVWLALGRKSFNEINFEVNRIFKSSAFNNVKYEQKQENRIGRGEDVSVLPGHCVKTSRLLKTMSPLINEVFCSRQVNFQMFGLGVIQYSALSSRLRYLEQCLIAPEKEFPEMKISLGIIGQPRARFDTILRDVNVINTGASSTSWTSGRVSMSRASKLSKKSVKVQSYPDIIIPEKIYTGEENAPKKFPDQMYPYKHCSDIQRKKWIARVQQSRYRHRKNMSLRSKNS